MWRYVCNTDHITIPGSVCPCSHVHTNRYNFGILYHQGKLGENDQYAYIVYFKINMSQLRKAKEKNLLDNVHQQRDTDVFYHCMLVL